MMRQSQQGKKPRGRGRKPHNPLSRVYESSGPDVKVRGTAAHVADKYMNLARDAQSSDDRVASENYLQHAEHYFRIIAAAQAQMSSASIAEMSEQPQPSESGAADDAEDRYATENGAFGDDGNAPLDDAPHDDGPQQMDQRPRRSRRRNGRGEAPGGDVGNQQPTGATAEVGDRGPAEQPAEADNSAVEVIPAINGSAHGGTGSVEQEESNAGAETETSTPSA